MKMKALRRLRTLAPRTLRRTSDATTEPDPGPSPESIFDRATGPCGWRHAAAAPSLGAHDDET